MDISEYLYRVSSIRVQIEAGKSNLLLFETFCFFLFFLHERVLEELALLKNKKYIIYRIDVYGLTALTQYFHVHNENLPNAVLIHKRRCMILVIAA